MVIAPNLSITISSIARRYPHARGPCLLMSSSLKIIWKTVPWNTTTLEKHTSTSLMIAYHVRRRLLLYLLKRLHKLLKKFIFVLQCCHNCQVYGHIVVHKQCIEKFTCLYKQFKMLIIALIWKINQLFCVYIHFILMCQTIISVHANDESPSEGQVWHTVKLVAIMTTCRGCNIIKILQDIWHTRNTTMTVRNEQLSRDL